VVKMPRHKVHCAISNQRTKGEENFSLLHRWIDEHHKEGGVNHRTKRHAYNEKEAKQIKEYWDKKLGRGWGDKAVVEWLFHIALDNLETAFRMSHKPYGWRTYNFFKFGFEPNSRFINFDFDRLDESGLEEEFEDTYEYEE
jgi:hypothetical protein